MLTKTPPKEDEDIKVKDRIHPDVRAQDCQLTCLGYCRYGCGGCWTANCVGGCASFCGRVNW